MATLASDVGGVGNNNRDLNPPGGFGYPPPSFKPVGVKKSVGGRALANLSTRGRRGQGRRRR